MSGISLRKIGTFLGLTFGISWSMGLLFWVFATNLSSIQGTILVVAGYMWAPAIAAIIVQSMWGDPMRTGTGLFIGRIRWNVVAWLTPVALLVLTVGIGILLPEVVVTTDYADYLSGLGLPEAQIQASLSAIDSVPLPAPLFFIIQGLFAGLTINAVAAFGEELGWRGLLLRELSPLGFWRVSIVTGLVWGIWHAPLILQGHNYPESPYLGILVMTGWTVAITPTFTYLAIRAQSVLAPTLFHGAFNAVASLSLLFLTGAGPLSIGPVGLAAIGAGVLVTGVCIVHDRYLAQVQVMTRKEIEPWPQ